MQSAGSVELAAFRDRLKSEAGRASNLLVPCRNVLASSEEVKDRWYDLKQRPMEAAGSEDGRAQAYENLWDRTGREMIQLMMVLRQNEKDFDVLKKEWEAFSSSAASPDPVPNDEAHHNGLEFHVDMQEIVYDGTEEIGDW